MKIQSVHAAILTLFIFSGTVVFSTEKTRTSDVALDEVIELLTSSEKRQKALKDQPQALEADQILKSLGGEQSEKLYQLAAKIFESLILQSQGNIEQVESILNKAKKNPEEFLKSLNPELRNAIKDVSSKIQKSQGTPKP